MIKVKRLFKYITIYAILLIVLFSSLVITAKIPKNQIEKNLKESAEFYKKLLGIKRYIGNRDYTAVHYYADSMLLNIIYCIDSNKPIESVMWANYYETIRIDSNKHFINLIEYNKEPNQQYIRYWHGSMIIIRPLLVFFNIEQIYLINKILMYSLSIILLIIIFIKSKGLALIYLIAMIMVVFPIVPYCFEYSWTFYIMLIASIIAILIEQKGDKGIYTLLFITGMLTCFFDFLSTEIITFLVPILLVLAIRKKENRINSLKEGFIFLIKGCILWLIAYVSMWLTKWVLAGIILKINPVDYIKDHLLLRINGLQGLDSKAKLYSGALYKNYQNLFPLNLVKSTKYLWIYTGIFIGIVILLIDWKNIKNKWFSLLMLIIGIMPYIRYLVLANHSYRHAFFTFRDQMITIIALLLIIVDCFKYKSFFKKIVLKKKWNR